MSEAGGLHYQTANGTGFAAVTQVSPLDVGPIRLANVPAAVNHAPVDASLLGMSFFRRLESLEVRASDSSWTGAAEFRAR